MAIQRLNIPDKWKHYFSEYPNGYTLLEAIIEWTNKVNIMIDDLNLTNEELKKFYDETLPRNLEIILDSWYESGKLADLINIQLLDKKADKIDLENLEQEFISSVMDINNTLSNHIDYISEYGNSVKRFGAKGDGVTDDTVAIQNALNSIENGSLFFPEGDYLISDTLYINKSNVGLSGIGKNQSVITFVEGVDFENKWAIQVKSEEIKTVDMLSNGITPEFLASKGDIWVEVSNIQNFNIGDIVSIKGDFSTSPWTSNNRDYLTKGETNVISDISGNQIRLEKPISESWTINEIVKITNYRAIENIEIKNIKILGLSSALYRGILLENTRNGVVRNCEIQNCGAMGIESSKSYKNFISSNTIKMSWVGDLSNSDLATLGLGYGLRATSDRSSFFTNNVVDIARHCFDISGNYPSRDVKFSDNIGTVYQNEYSCYKTHGTAENCVFDGNIANGGRTGFQIDGENITLINNIINGGGMKFTGRKYIIKNNNIAGSISFTTPEINDENNFVEISNNVITGTSSLIYLTRTPENNFDSAFNFKVTDNTLYSPSKTRSYIFDTTYIGSATIEFMHGLTIKNNVGYREGMALLKLNLSTGSNTVIGKWTYIISDFQVSWNPPLDPYLGQATFLKSDNKPYWWNGESWVDAQGITRP